MCHRPPGLLTRGLAPATRAPGPHALAVRSRVARLTRRSRPSHPAPRPVTIGHTPPCHRDGMSGMNHTFAKNRTIIYFAKAEILLDIAIFDRAGKSPRKKALSPFESPADVCKAQTTSPELFADMVDGFLFRTNETLLIRPISAHEGRAEIF